MKINLIGSDAGFGLAVDLRIVRDILEAAGHTLTYTGTRPDRLPAKLRRHFYRHVLRRPVFDMNIFMEKVDSNLFEAARVNCLIPNPEWCRADVQRHLHRFDVVLCKTHHAINIFEGRGCRTEYIGFTSGDRFVPGHTMDYALPFHLAGRSFQKGTGTVRALWESDPALPELVIVQNAEKKAFEPSAAPNIRHLTTRIEESLLRELQNTRGLHLCISEAEGFGHSIVEAMSCKAIVITSDGAPMNELIAPDRGVVVEAAVKGQQNLSNLYGVTPEALRVGCERVWGMTAAEQRAMGEAARAWYLENDRVFRERFPEVIAGLV